MSRAGVLLPLLLLLCSAPPAAGDGPGGAGGPGSAGGAEADTDEDGLTDFDEVHTYLTNPAKRDSDEDGTPDGDWEERREHAYSLRVVMRVLPPVPPEGLEDAFQDGRIVATTPEALTIEAVLYPNGTADDALRARKDWREGARTQAAWLAPGPTCNVDDDLRVALTRDLMGKGIDLARLDDLGTVAAVAQHALKHAAYDGRGFTTYFVEAQDGKLVPHPGLAERVATEARSAGRTSEEQFRHEVLGKDMYVSRCRGSCTSTAVYLATLLRAAGIPARLVLGIPIADASDPAQVALVESGVREPALRAQLLRSLSANATAFAAHTFNEVFVGGRWWRLDSDRLAPGPSGGIAGFLVRVNQFADLADAGLAATWGRRYARQDKTDLFPGSNPYRLVSLEDGWGQHARRPQGEPR